MDKYPDTNEFGEASQGQLHDLFSTIAHGLIVKGEMKYQDDGAVHFEKTIERSGGYKTDKFHSIELTFVPRYFDEQSREEVQECSTIKTVEYVFDGEGVKPRRINYNFIRKDVDSEQIDLIIAPDQMWANTGSNEDVATRQLSDEISEEMPTELSLTSDEAYTFQEIVDQLQ